MPKRPPRSEPVEPLFTQDHVGRAIERFQKRLFELEYFEPKSIEDRRDPRITTLEIAIEETLADAFGRGTPSYNNYFAASQLDTARHNVDGVPIYEVVQGLHRGQARAVALLKQAAASLGERLVD